MSSGTIITWNTKYDCLLISEVKKLFLVSWKVQPVCSMIDFWVKKTSTQFLQNGCHCLECTEEREKASAKQKMANFHMTEVFAEKLAYQFLFAVEDLSREIWLNKENLSKFCRKFVPRLFVRAMVLSFYGV